MPLYTNDPNDSKKQLPDVTPNGIHRFSYAVCPAAEGITKRPSYVTVNQSGSYAFAYESGSVSTYITGSVVAENGGPIRLDINPVAWRETDSVGTVGDVTFVYVRVS